MFPDLQSFPPFFHIRGFQLDLGSIYQDLPCAPDLPRYFPFHQENREVGNRGYTAIVYVDPYNNKSYLS